MRSFPIFVLFITSLTLLACAPVNNPSSKKAAPLITEQCPSPQNWDEMHEGGSKEDLAKILSEGEEGEYVLDQLDVHSKFMTLKKDEILVVHGRAKRTVDLIDGDAASAYSSEALCSAGPIDVLNGSSNAGLRARISSNNELVANKINLKLQWKDKFSTEVKLDEVAVEPAKSTEQGDAEAKKEVTNLSNRKKLRSFVTRIDGGIKISSGMEMANDKALIRVTAVGFYRFIRKSEIERFKRELRHLEMEESK